MVRAFGIAALVVGLAGCGIAASDTAGTLGSGEARVVRVVDGDTIVVELATGTEKVRLIGIDTPEEKKPNTPIECYAPEAAARTRELLPERTLVRLERDKEPRDRYGRLLAYVTRASDGLSIEAALLQDGYAAPLVIAPNTTHATEYAAIAADAQRNARGIWGACGGPHVVR